MALHGSSSGSVAPLTVESANVVAQRNGVTAQSFYVYNTYTDASNYERGAIDWSTSANTLTIGAQKAGTGSARQVVFAGGSYQFTSITGGNLFQVTAGGNLTWNTDVSNTLGAPTTSRPLAVYAGFYGSAITSQSGTTYTAAASDSSIIFTSASTVTLTLPAAASFTGRKFHLKTTGGGAVNSATSNVVAKAGGAAAATILGATAGTWAELQSDGTNWIVMAGT